MMEAYINAISYYLPQNELTNEDLSLLFPEWDVKKIANKIGIKKRHIAATDEFASDMAIIAAKKLFEEYQILPSDIDFVLYCTQSPDYFLPSTSCIIQTQLAIPTSAGALDFNLGCSGYVYGLAVAKGLISAGIAKNILLLTSETYSKLINEKDKGNRTIFGDAAAATLVSTTGLAKIGDFSLGTDGTGASHLMVKNGAIRNPNSNNEISKDDAGNFLHMDGPEIFAFTIKQVPKLIQETLEKNNLIEEEIDLFILHQANQYMLEHLRKKLDITQERFYYYMSTIGNTVSSTIPIALYQALKEKDFSSGANWLLAGFGVGYSWGGTTLTFK